MPQLIYHQVVVPNNLKVCIIYTYYAGVVKLAIHRSLGDSEAGKLHQRQV